MADNRLYIDGRDWFLAGSGCTDTATTIVLQSMKYPDGVTNVVTADIGALGRLTLEPGTSRQEVISFTTITQNANGTATISGITRGISPMSPYSASASYRFSHAGGTTARFSNPAAFYDEFTNKNNDETILQTWTFTEATRPGLTADLDTAVNEKLVTFGQLSRTSFAGTVNASTVQKGIVEMATAAEATAGTATGGTGASLVIDPAVLAAQIQSGSWTSGVTAGTADAITATLTPTVTALTHNMMFSLHVTTANNAGATLDLDGLGARAIFKYAGGTAVAVEANDMQALYHHIFLYDSDAGVFLLVNPVNGTLTSAMQTEVQNFFSTTTMTGAQATTLVAGPTSDSDALHTHNALVNNYFVPIMFNSAAAATILGATGYSDASPDKIAVGVHVGGATDIAYTAALYVSADIGNGIYLVSKDSSQLDSTSQDTTSFPLYIGTDIWVADSTSNIIDKNGTAVTISGTGRFGPLGHDSTNASLLVLYSTTKIAKFSGIAGTTITNLASDVTLDTAVSQVGFVFDDTNDQYVCVDLTANILRKFNSTGVTVETAAYTITDTNVKGVVLIGDRYYLAVTVAQSYTAINQTDLTVSFIPTSMKRG